MKKYSHVYVALKSIELLYDGLENLSHAGKIDKQARKRYRAEASRLQHLLDLHRGFTMEAAWAPDEVLRDMSPNHIFKLYNAADFPGAELGIEPRPEDTVRGDDGVRYYRAAGALPYRIDHLCRFINNSMKLKGYSDCFSQQQILYLMLLLSHYVTDAHVPLHCDARDLTYNDAKQMPGAEKFYYKTYIDPASGERKDTELHAWIEDRWEEACVDVGTGEGLFKAMRGDYDKKAAKSSLSSQVSFSPGNAKIRPTLLTQDKLLSQLVQMCIESKKLSHAFVDPAEQQRAPGPLSRDRLQELTAGALAEWTREIFARSISAVISVWMFCWIHPYNLEDARGG